MSRISKTRSEAAIACCSVAFTRLNFLIGAYIVVLMSTNYIAEGDYYEGEYYFLLLSSILGMVVMASSRRTCLRALERVVVEGAGLCRGGLRLRP